MSLNDRTLISESVKGADIHPGVANPTSVSGGTDPVGANFMKDPTTEEVGAGAGPNFDGHNQANRFFKETAGVVEGRPGVIESTNIDPLNENSNKDDGWANATVTPGTNARDDSDSSTYMTTATNAAAATANVAAGAAKLVYGHAVGDEEVKKAGSEAVFGKN